MKRFDKSGFTLAELMIVLVVMGVLAGVLLPVANNSRPNENVMKFKKANGTLGNVIRELVTSSQYFGSDLAHKPGDSASANGQYFCNAFADVLSVKSQSCKTTTNTSYASYTLGTVATAKTTFDSHCLNTQSVGAEIVTSDGVTWYQSSPGTSFVADKDGNGFFKVYKVLCVDVDGLNTGVRPFGYGIRIDGKMLSGARADVWLSKCPMQKVPKAQWKTKLGLTDAEITECSR